MVYSKTGVCEKCMLNKMWDEGYVDKINLNYKKLTQLNLCYVCLLSSFCLNENKNFLIHP